MPAFSGKDGSVMIGQQEIADVTKWSAEHKVATGRFGSSTSGGWKQSVPGVQEITGDFEAKLQETGNYPTVGVSATMTLDTGQLTLNGSAIITSVSLEVDMDNGEPVGFKASFESNGAWTITPSSSSSSSSSE